MFLIDNPNRRYKQYTYPRRGGGYTAPQIVLHTYEAPYTRSLLAAATWLTTRNTPGSYHALAGARSAKDVLQLAPWSYETWHSVPSNNWSIGISAVTYASAWNKIPRSARENLVKSMAYAAANAAKWLEKHHGRVVKPRLLTRAQAMRKESGFVYHATMDPGRRTDPGKDFPWTMFINEFNRLMKGGSPAPTTPTVPKGHLDMHPDELNRHLSRHAENVHAGVQRDIKRLVVPLLENLAGAIAAAGAGETFDEAKLLAGVQESAERGSREGALQAEETLRQALVETLAEQPDRDDAAIADAVVSKIATRLSEGN